MTERRKLQISLAIIRFSIGLFFLIWSIRKIASPESGQKIFNKFYFLQISPSISIFLGITQTLIILLFLAGLYKTITYGALLGMHIVSLLSTYQQLLAPYAPGNTLFWAGVPVLGSLIALFILRENDDLLAISSAKN